MVPVNAFQALVAWAIGRSVAVDSLFYGRGSVFDHCFVMHFIVFFLVCNNKFD